MQHIKCSPDELIKFHYEFMKLRAEYCIEYKGFISRVEGSIEEAKKGLRQVWLDAIESKLTSSTMKDIGKIKELFTEPIGKIEVYAKLSLSGYHYVYPPEIIDENRIFLSATCPSSKKLVSLV